MNQNNFTEEDKEKLIEFLNFIFKHASWGRKTDFGSEETMKYTRLLSFMQQVLLNKVNEHILEVKKVVEAPQEENNESENKE